MRRVLLAFLVILTAFSFLSCAGRTPSNNTEVSFYYIHTEMKYGTQTPLLTKTTRNISDSDNNYDSILRLYLNGPITYDCVSPFPGGTELVEIYVDGNRANLVLSPHIGTLPPAQQTVACACLTKTVMELTGATTVQIRLENSLINGKEVASFTQESFALFDTMTQADISQ